MPSLLRIKGLATFNNILSEVPEGSLLIADNINIDRESVAEPRRGFRQYGDARADQLLVYKGAVLAHNAPSGVLQYETLNDSVSGKFSSFDGNYFAPEAGVRIKGTEVNGNFYFTTADGIKKISATNATEFSNASGYITNSGVVRAVDVNGTVNYADPLWFQPRSKVGYRVVFGTTDINNNLILGAPSEFLEVTNFSFDDNAAVDIVITVPQGIDSTNFIYQVYRSALYSENSAIPLADVTVEDELFLVEEANVPASSLISKTIAFTDITPDDIRRQNAPLYTNIRTGSGILQANNQPPIAKDIALFNNQLFFANTQTRQTKQVNFLAIDDIPEGVGQFIISDGTNTDVYTFRGVQEVSTIDLGASSYTLPTGLNQKFFTLAAASDERKYLAYFSSSPSIEEPVVTGFDGYLPIKIDTSTNNIRQFGVSGTYSYASGDWTGNYFTLDSANDENQFYVWYRTSSGQIPTLVANRAGIEVNIIGFTSLSSVMIATKNTIEESAASSFFDVSINSPTNNTLTFTNKEKGSVTSAIETFASSSFFASDTYTVSLSDVVNAVTGAISASAGFDFEATASGNIVTITNREAGAAEDTADGVAPFDTGFTFTTVTQGAGESSSGNFVLLSTSNSVAIGIRNTSRSLVKIANQNTTGLVNAYYVSNPADIAGQLLFEARDLSDPPFYFAVNTSGMGVDFSPTLPYTRSISSIANVSGSIVQVTSSGHGFTTNTPVILYGTDSTPNITGVYPVLSPTINTFNIDLGTLAPTGLATPASAGFVFEATTSSSNDIFPNRVYWSKFQQPEAVPTLNYEDVGPRDKPIRRIVALRDSLFILKEDGIYRLVGQNSNFSIQLFDNSAQITAPDTAAILNNLIYAYTTQGVVAISETGVQIISREIEDKLRVLASYGNFNRLSFGQGYETDRAYLLSTPISKQDTYARQIFRYNIFTRSWTRWLKDVRSSVLDATEDILYLGAGDQALVERERKQFDRTDIADREFERSIIQNSVTGNIITLDNVQDVRPGDALVQFQNLSTAQFNRLLLKLNSDNLIASTSFYPNLEAVPGDNIATKVVLLANSLDGIPSLSGEDFTGAMVSGDEFAIAQTNFNTIVDKLNNSTGVFYSNYTPSSGNLEFENIVLEVNPIFNSVTGSLSNPYLFGPITHYKNYEKNVTWTPVSFGDVSLLKQVREGTMIFLNDNFTLGAALYASDLSPSFEGTVFQKLGDGSWGKFVWGEHTWGGEGTGVPLRTYIPRNKQRCRYLNVRFLQNTARETFQLYGCSLEVREISSRAYRR